MQNIDISKPADIDSLYGKFLKHGAEILVKPITEICNLSITSITFLNTCKVVSSCLFLRKSKKLPHLILKILERFTHGQTNVFLKGNNLRYNYQSGFRTNHSTNICFSFSTDKILKGFDKGLLTGIILTDLQKAFETTNHEILFTKLNYGLL